MNHLMLELEQSNQRFQQQLQSRFQRLTPYDVRLCIYLKANLSTKEIAILLNITPDSVKKAKHRLRKKLALSADISWGTAFSI